jgi:heat-inducible transcriptional repressor
MLDERKTAILRAIVSEYIETAQPVGSSHVAVSAGINVSSATIRNEMAVLEQEGYLAQPHTSAGRVPTDKGYRVFVDTMASPGRLDAAQTQQVRSFFEASHGAIERMLADTTRLLTSLTDYAAVLVGPAPEVATIRSVQLVALSQYVATMVIVLANGTVEHRHVESTEGIDEARSGAVSAHLTRALQGSVFGSLPDPPPTGDVATDALTALTMEILHGLTQSETAPVYVAGASRAVIGTLEQQYVVVGLVRDVIDRGLSVAIGLEHGVEPLAACSVVVAPYRVEGEAVGSVGVLGPTRMNYPQALAAVEVVSEKLGRRLGEQ